MERKKFGNLLAIFAIAVLAIAVMPTSAAPAKENPYEHWIEPSELKKCEILFSFNALYSVDGINAKTTEEIWTTAEGKFNKTRNTFEGSYKEEDDKSNYKIDAECTIFFDPGVNEVIGLKMSGTECSGNCELNFKIDATKKECVIPRLYTYQLKLDDPEIKAELSEEEIEFVEQFYRQNTFFIIIERETCECVKLLEIDVACKEDKKTKRVKLTDYKCDDESFMHIKFEGFLPELPAYEGKCSHFGGKNDTGVDKVLREKFYDTNLGKFGSNFLMSYKEFYKIKEVREEFDKWMNKKPRSEWEGTGLDCGKARDLDTENDYFCAMRWHDRHTQNYGEKGKPGHQHWWREQKIKVTNPATKKSAVVRPVDWGPNEDIDRVIDVSNKTLNVLGAGTDDWVEICFADPKAPLGLVTN
jgi:hypothetical protein